VDFGGSVYFSRIPEISDDDMEYQQEVNEGALRHDQKPFLKQHRLFPAVFAEFMYVGSAGIQTRSFTASDIS
jgi:FHS family L-fucose permease-like MFS transporter